MAAKMVMEVQEASKGVMRKRARDKGRRILDTSKERAGVSARRRKRRKPEPVYQLEEEPEAEETSRDGGSKRKSDGELNLKNKNSQKKLTCFVAL
jgi:hypothetical protein